MVITERKNLLTINQWGNYCFFFFFFWWTRELLFKCIYIYILNLSLKGQIQLPLYKNIFLNLLIHYTKVCDWFINKFIFQTFKLQVNLEVQTKNNLGVWYGFKVCTLNPYYPLKFEITCLKKKKKNRKLLMNNPNPKEFRSETFPSLETAI